MSVSRNERQARRGATIPPMGQGLAVIATLALVAVVSLLAIGAYLLSLRINDHRRSAAAIDQRIAAIRQDSERLRLELVLRSRFPELRRWSAILGLGTPRVAEQLASPRDLAGETASQTADPVPAPLSAEPRRAGYAPKARHQLDDLIGSIAR